MSKVIKLLPLGPAAKDFSVKWVEVAAVGTHEKMVLGSKSALFLIFISGGGKRK